MKILIYYLCLDPRLMVVSIGSFGYKVVEWIKIVLRVRVGRDFINRRKISLNNLTSHKSHMYVK